MPASGDLPRLPPSGKPLITKRLAAWWALAAGVVVALVFVATDPVDEQPVQSPLDVGRDHPLPGRIVLKGTRGTQGASQRLSSDRGSLDIHHVNAVGDEDNEI